MTTAIAINICKSIADKYGSPIVSDTDWTNYLNMAQYEVVNKLSDDAVWGSVNVDTDSNTLDSVRQLVYPITLIPAAGLLTNAQINTALQTASGDASCSLFRILNMSLASNNAIIKFIRFNNINAYNSNVFKAPTQTYPGFVIQANGIQVYPQIALSVNLACLKSPKVLTNTGESLEYDDYTNNVVLFTTIKLAGVQIRDEDVAFDIRNTNIESAK